MLGSPQPAIVLTPWFPNVPGEREGNYVYDSARAISEQGWPISVLVARPLRPGTLGRLGGERHRSELNRTDFVEFDHVRLVRHLSFPRNLLPRARDLLLDRSLTPALIRLVAETRSRVIHAHTEALAPAAVAAGKATDSRVVVTLHGVNLAPRYFDLPARRRRFRRALSEADRVIIVGEPLRGFFRELVGSDDHFRVVPNGFSLMAAERHTPVLAAGREIRFISVSNLNEGKGIDINLEALSKLQSEGMKDWTYTVVGDGEQQGRLLGMVRESRLESRVRFVGARPHEEIARFLADADVFILPSYREAFGIAYLEAMSAGLLVLGVRDQGPSAFIEHGVSGLLVAPRDVASLAKQLSLIMSDVEPFRAVAENAKTASERFTWRRHAEDLAAIYREVLEELL